MNPLRLSTLGSNTFHPHQISAIQWMMERETDLDYRGGFLCDEMGLGKTFTVAGLLMNTSVRRSLILMPLAVVAQWTEVMLMTGLAVYNYTKSGWKKMGGWSIRGCIYITNYDKLTTDTGLLNGPWDRLILDEAHTMRNSSSKKWLALKGIPATRKWFLTGTPIVNRVMDMSSLMHILNRSVSEKISSKTAASEWMASYALYRRVDQVKEILPNLFAPSAKTIHHRLDFKNPEEEAFYKRIQTDAAVELQYILAQNHVNMINFLQVLLRLRQISLHPQVYIESQRKRIGAAYRRPNWEGDSSKTDAIIKILQEEDGSHNYVIFCHFTQEIMLLKKRLEKEKSVGSVLVYDGSLSSEQRTQVIQKTKNTRTCMDVKTIDKTIQLVWKKRLPSDILNHVIGPMLGRHTILLAQIQSAGTGINLQHMDRVIFTTPWWTAALMDQAIGRVVRLGQKRPVVIHHLAHKAEEELSQTINIDDYINTRVEEKRELCEELLSAAQSFV